MTVPPHRFARRTRAVPETVPELRRALREYAVEAGAPERLVLSVQLAVSEAVSNVVSHAYIDHPEPGDVIAEAWVDHPQLVICVSDEGRGLRPRVDSPGLGLGLPLLTAMVDDLEIAGSADQPGVRLTMRFALDGSGPAADAMA